ncbi:MAG: TolC family protein [Saprospiraceae bacterium]|nr:TolC family protein [Saprospiraceae bacterium]
MKCFYQHIILFALILGIGQSVRAQALQQLLVQADTSNLELKALYQEYLASLEKAPQVSQLPEPEAGVGLFPLPVETRLGAQWVRLSATQMFPWKGTLDARKEVALAMANTQYEKVAAARLELHFSVKEAWFQLYEISAKQQILKESISIFETLESISTTKVETGKGSLADVLRIQVKIRGLREELNILESQKEKPVSTINRLLNRPAGTTVQMVSELNLAVPVYNRDSILSNIRTNHPMLRMFSLQQETARKNITLNALEGKPSLSAGLDYISVAKRTDADPTSNGRDILSPRLGVRVPIYREKYRAKEQEERLKIEALEIWKDERFLQFRAAIEKAYAELEQERLKYNLYADQRETTQSAIDLMLSQYSTENAGFVDLLMLEDQLIQYDLMQLSAIVNTHLAQAKIERYIP